MFPDISVAGLATGARGSRCDTRPEPGALFWGRILYHIADQDRLDVSLNYRQFLRTDLQSQSLHLEGGFDVKQPTNVRLNPPEY